MTFPQQSFIPASQIISSITQANPGVVTTVNPHNYSNNIQVRLVIPPDNGMQGATGNIYICQVLSPTTFSINQDTTNFSAFLS